MAQTPTTPMVKMAQTPTTSFFWASTSPRYHTPKLCRHVFSTVSAAARGPRRTICFWISRISHFTKLILVVFGAAAATGTASQKPQQAESLCAPADSYATLEAGMADKQESPCFFSFAESNIGGEAYHTIYCNGATLAGLHTSLTDYRQRNCTEEIFLQIAKFDHPLDVTVFRGLETRLRVLIIMEWDPLLPGFDDSPIVEREAAAKFYGSPFKELTELLVLDVRLNHLDDSLFLTEAFFEGLRGLRILQTENLAAKALISLDVSRMFPELRCVGVHETENRNCSCADAEEIAELTTWRMGATTPGDRAPTTVADPLKKDLYHACKVGINCYLKDPTSDTHTAVSFTEDVRKKACPDYGKRTAENLLATTTSNWLANTTLPFGTSITNNSKQLDTSSASASGTYSRVTLGCYLILSRYL
ncbi:hypothetical protein BV898_17634 [Hypsibius exemplaris]|uniref:Uncharacterized protein n=1 Tax=Hypsibius exemplaris TaxID=2072580 RepID=A0A9X6NML8_HYPEX|nr:hypothetical protein BV898_17634 [Hypsibius exemplaris]